MSVEKIVAHPTSQYILLDSKDRNQTTIQPWNRFTLQKPQALLDAFAKRLMVAEVRFPWYIPNISPLNNTLTIVDDNGGAPTIATITVPPGFYSPQSLATKLTSLMAGLSSVPVVTYNTVTQKYSIAVTGTPGAIFTIYFFNPAVATPPQTQYLSNASLCRTLGLQYEQVSGIAYTTGDVLVGQPTETLYTSYVDIVSTRLTRLQKARDGDSANNSQGSMICRIYLADEASTPLIGVANLGMTAPGSYGSFPLLIHRQFKCPKSINWSPELFIDYMDISVLDEYNNIVPLLPQGYGGSFEGGSFLAQYPDFQITLLASE